MTIGTDIAESGPLYPDGIATSFPFDFEITRASDLSAIWLSVDGTQTPISASSYTVAVSLSEPGGTITFSTAPTLPNPTDELWIILDPEFEQQDRYSDEGPFNQSLLEGSLDKLARLSIYLLAQVRRGFSAPFGEEIASLPPSAQRANGFLGFDADGNPVVSAGTGADGGLRSDLAASTGSALVRWVQAGVGAISRLVRDKLRERVSVQDFDARGDGVTDDRAAIQAAIDYVADTLGGGDVVFPIGSTFRVVIGTAVPDKGLIVKDNVRLVGGKGTTLSLECTGDVYGVRLKNSAGVKRLTIRTAISVTPGLQGIWHAPISIGPAYGEGGTVGAVSSFEYVSGWSIRDVILSNARTGGGGYLIQGIGGIHGGVIDGVEAPDSATSSGIVMFDWGFVGTITSSDIAASRTNFNAGTAFTTHPHDIDIRNIRAGILSNSNSHGVRLSGCYGIRVDGVDIAACNYAGVYHHAGDVGFEFAPAGVKPMRFTPNVIRNVNIEDANDGWGVFADNIADNIAAAVSGSGYVPLLDPVQRADLTLENCCVRSDGGAGVSSGFRIQMIKGVRLINPVAIGFSNGILIEEQASDILISNPHVTGNRSSAIYVGHGSRAGDGCTIEGGEIYDNSKDAGAGNQAAIFVQAQPNVSIIGVTIGRDGVSEGVIWGVRADSAVTGLTVERNHVEAVKAGGVGYSFGSGGDFAILKSFRNNTVGGTVANNWGGATIQVIETRIDTDGVVRRTMRAARASLTSDTVPSGGPFVKGDIIFYNDPDASGFLGTLCTVSGSPGTWKKFGSVEA